MKQKSVKRHANTETFQFYIRILNLGPVTFYTFTIFHLEKKITYFIAVIAVYCLVSAGKLLY